VGEHAGAAEAAAGLARAAFQPANDAPNAACFFAGCVPPAHTEAKLPQARRQERTRFSADRGLAALRQAVADGYRDAAHIKEDTDLDALCGRDDFRKLLAEPEKGAGRGKP
jgi:hypothetical protein